MWLERNMVKTVWKGRCGKKFKRKAKDYIEGWSGEGREGRRMQRIEKDRGDSLGRPTPNYRETGREEKE